MSATRSERVLAALQPRLRVSAEAPPLRAMADRTISQPMFARYLAIEEAFVRTAIRVVCFCAWAEPDAAKVLLHLATARHLVDDQLPYFARVRERWALDEATRERVVAASGVLSDHVHDAVALFGYPGAIVAMFTAESLYSAWGMAAVGAGEPDGDVEHWIAMHAGAPFTDGVGFLAELVDALPGTIPDATVLDWAHGMLAAEDAFHATADPGRRS